MKVKTIGLVAVAAMTVATSHANNWGNHSSGNWTNATNWDDGTVPGALATDRARFDIDNTGATIDSDVGSIDRLEVGRKSTGNTLALNTGGVLDVNQFRIGANNSADSGTMTIDGGALTIAGGTHGIGYEGTGVVNLNSGSFTSTADLLLGRSQDSTGTMNMSGGTLAVAANIQVGGVTSGGLIDPTRTGVEGIFNLSGGTVTTAKINVGKAGDGTLTITGGNLTAGTFRAESHDGYTGVINLTAGTVHADKVIMGLNGTLNLASAATLDTYTNMSFAANGLLVWEGDRSSEVATLAGDGTFAGADGVVDISTLTLGVDYDEAFGTGSELLVYKYDSGADETKVWTVIPEPATLGLVSFVGLATLFVRRRLMM